jgi:hypothetical protein
MPDETFAMEWVCREAEAATLAAGIEAEGGRVTGTAPFAPDAAEVDHFADPQFDPLLALTLVLGVPLALRLLRRAVADLRGRTGTVLIFDLSGDTPQARHVPLEDARVVIVKGKDGQEIFDPANVGGIEAAFLDLAKRFPTQS